MLKFVMKFVRLLLASVMSIATFMGGFACAELVWNRIGYSVYRYALMSSLYEIHAYGELTALYGYLAMAMAAVLAVVTFQFVLTTHRPVKA